MMKKRPMKEEVNEILRLKIDKYKLRLESANLNETHPMTMNELKQKIKSSQLYGCSRQCSRPVLARC